MKLRHKLTSIAAAISELKAETDDDRTVAYRIEFQPWLLRVKVLHVPSGKFKIAGLF